MDLASAAQSGDLPAVHHLVEEQGAAVDAAVAVAGLLRWPASEDFVPQPSHRLHAGVSALELWGWAYVSEELRGNRDVVLETVKQIGMASR